MIDNSIWGKTWGYVTLIWNLRGCDWQLYLRENLRLWKNKCSAIFNVYKIQQIINSSYLFASKVCLLSYSWRTLFLSIFVCHSYLLSWCCHPCLSIYNTLSVLFYKVFTCPTTVWKFMVLTKHVASNIKLVKCFCW